MQHVTVLQVNQPCSRTSRTAGGRSWRISYSLQRRLQNRSAPTHRRLTCCRCCWKRGVQVWHALLRRVLGRPRHPVWVAVLHLWLHVQRPRSTEAARGDLVTRDTNLALCLQNEVVEAAVVRMEGLGQPHLNDRSAELRRHVAQTPRRLPLSVRGRHLQNAVVEEVDSKHAQRHQAVVKLMRSS
eukprot:SAG31_NODE_18132_length_646_cov_0.634369_1_plen_183_part_01